LKYKKSAPPDESLIARYKKTGERMLRDKIINEYLYIAELVTMRYMGRGVEYDDLFQVCCVGLILAVERFDMDKGVKFQSFATPTVIGEVKRYFRDKVFAIKVPRRLYNLYKEARILGETQEYLSPKEMAERLGVLEKDVLEVLNWELGSLVTSLNNEDTLGGYDDAFIDIENRAFVDRCMEKLKEREREFVRLRYYQKMSQNSIAKEMNITQMTISRLEKKVLDKLKKMYFS